MSQAFAEDDGTALALAWQEMFINTVTSTLERKNSREQEVQSGWFTTEEMGHSLGWSKKLDSMIYAQLKSVAEDTKKLLARTKLS